jgi:hypothetical protein
MTRQIPPEALKEIAELRGVCALHPLAVNDERPVRATLHLHHNAPRNSGPMTQSSERGEIENGINFTPQPSSF